MRTAAHHMILALAFACACVAGLAAGARAQGASFPPLLELRVPKSPAVAPAEGGGLLTYELHVTNFTGQPMTVRRIEVLAGEGEGRVLHVLEDSTLAAAMVRPGVTLDATQRPVLGGGLRAVVFVWMQVDAETPPSALRHRLTIEAGRGDSVRVSTLEGASIVVSSDVPTIGPPLRGGDWYTGNGPAPATGHRRALIPVDGVPAIAQRFAIDYVKLGAEGRTFEGDRLRNESYHAYGEDALAVADGTVVAVVDGIPENVPGPQSRAVPITLETVGGNHVILDIGGGVYAFYAHLQPGSLRVGLGDRVGRGQVLGLVGNSGNSTEPHLHFHLSDGNSPLGSEGVPYVHESFEIVGRCRTFGIGCSRSDADLRRGELPLGNVLIRFPE